MIMCYSNLVEHSVADQFVQPGAPWLRLPQSVLILTGGKVIEKYRRAR